MAKLKPRAAARKPDDSSAALRAISLLEHIAGIDTAVSLADLVPRVGLPKPTVHRVLLLLERAGLLTREPAGKSYSVGARLARLGRDVMLNASVRAARHTILRRLVEEVGETCNLTMLDQGQVLYIDRVESSWPLRVDLKAGSMVPLHCSASGKLFISRLTPAKRRTLLPQLTLTRFTENTITDIAALEAELEKIRGKGVAVDNEEYLAGLVCVAVPVVLNDGRLCASLAVQAPVARLSVARALDHVPSLMRAAQSMAGTFELPDVGTLAKAGAGKGAAAKPRAAANAGASARTPARTR
jgi:IclR family transcriptional regulator, acetate operon repressor